MQTGRLNTWQEGSGARAQGGAQEGEVYLPEQARSGGEWSSMYGADLQSSGLSVQSLL